MQDLSETQTDVEVFETFSVLHDNAANRLPLMVATVSEKQATAPMHSHLFHELAIVLDGTGVYNSQTTEFQLTPGDVFMLNPGMIHSYSQQQHLEVANVLFWPDQLNLSLCDLKSAPGYRAFFELEPQARDQYGFNGRLTLSTENLERARVLLRHLAEELEEQRDGFLLMATTYLYQLFALICRAFSASTDEAHYELMRLEKVIEFMQDNYRSNISRSDLAKAACMSESSLYRRFTSLLGKSPMQYLTDLRLAKAAELFQHGDYNVTETAMRCGFNDGNYFGTLFRKHFGITPNQYRRQHRQKP